MALTCGSPVSGTAPAGGAGLLLLRLVVGMPPERLAAEDLKRLVTDQFSLAVVVCRDDYFGGALGRFAQRRERRRRAPVDDPGEVRPLDHVAEVLETPPPVGIGAVSYTHLRAHETDSYLVCRLLLEKKKKNNE